MARAKSAETAGPVSLKRLLPLYAVVFAGFVGCDDCARDPDGSYGVLLSRDKSARATPRRQFFAGLHQFSRCHFQSYGRHFSPAPS
jgi:hypothetical protein